MNEAIEAFKSICVIIVAVEIIGIVWVLIILWIIKVRERTQIQSPSTWPLPAETFELGENNAKNRHD